MNNLHQGLIKFIFFLYFMIYLSSSFQQDYTPTIIPLEKISRSLPTNSNQTYLQSFYFLNVTFNDDLEKPLRMYIDLYEPFIIQFCCSNNFETNYCYPSISCTSNSCTKCPEIKRKITYWNPSFKNLNELKKQDINDKSLITQITIDRNIPNRNIRQMRIGNVEKNYPTTSISSLNYYNIEIGYLNGLTENDKNLPFKLFDHVDGILGMGYGVFNVSFKSIVEKVDPINKLFAIDFNDNKESQLFVNGGNLYIGKDTIDNELIKNRDDLENIIYWSERQYRMNNYIWSYLLNNPTDQYIYTYEHRFTIYDLSFICKKNQSYQDINLFSNYTNNWQVSINNRIDGISLPNVYYDAIMNWLISYSKSKQINNLPFNQWDKEMIDSLPAITFSLQEDSNNLFTIPLSILFDKDVGLKIYKRKESMFVIESGVVTSDPSIEFGLDIWTKLFIPIFDYSKNRIGILRRKNQYSYNSNFCTLISNENTCIGAQSFYEPKNECLDPKCNAYFFQYVNPVTKTCDLTISFYFAIFVLVVVCAILEIAVFEFYLKMSHKLQEASRTTTPRIPTATTTTAN